MSTPFQPFYGIQSGEFVLSAWTKLNPLLSPGVKVDAEMIARDMGMPTYRIGPALSRCRYCGTTPPPGTVRCPSCGAPR